MPVPPRRRITRHHSWVLACLVLSLLSGCDPQAETAPPSSGPVLETIPFPNLAQLGDASQQRLRETYQRLQALREEQADPLLLGRAFGEMGKLLHAYRYQQAAMVSYRNAERLLPADYRWPYLEALLYRRDGRRVVAIRGLQRSVQLMQQDVSVPPQQVMAALTHLGELYLEGQQPEPARLMFEQALKIRPRAPSALFGLGQAAAQQKEYSRAIEYYRQVQAQAPNAKIVDYHLGMAFRALGETAEAKAHLAKSEGGTRPLRAYDPLLKRVEDLVVTAESAFRRGNQALKRHQPEQAAVWYHQALTLDSKLTAAHMNLGHALHQQGREAEALAAYRQEVALHPGLAAAQQMLAAAYQRQGDLERALQHLQQARTLAPNDTWILRDYARLLLAQGRSADALAGYRAILELEPANESALLGEAAALSQVEDCASAIRALEQARQRLPDAGRVSDGLARLLLTCDAARDPQRSWALAREVANADQRPRYAETAAMASAALGEFAAAIRWQQEAIRRAASTPRPLRRAHLQRVLDEYYRQGRVWLPDAENPERG